MHVTVMPDNFGPPVMQFEVHVTYFARRGTANMEGLGDGLLNSTQYQMAARALFDTGEVTLKYVITDIATVMRGEVLVINKLVLAFSLEPIRLGSGLIQNNRIEPKDHLAVAVAVVQDSNSKPLRWIRYYSTLIEIVPTTSLIYDEGVYLFVQGGESIEDRAVRFDLDDPMSPFRCFSDETEARKFRWREAQPEIPQLRAKLQKLIDDTEEGYTQRKYALELENKRQLAEIAMDKERLAHESRIQEAILKEKSARRQDEYEERSVARKSSSEALKILPTMLTLGAAIIGLI